MKTINIYNKLFLTTFAVLLTTGGVWAQTNTASAKKEKEKQEELAIKAAVDARNFIFKAQTMIPQAGMSRQLNYDYDLSITDDSVISFLPYMGRVYAPIMDPSEGPLRFTSTKFAYNTTVAKKGGWNISIKPKDVRSVNEFNLSVSKDGYATLVVTGNDRQSITFYGYILDKKA